MIDGGGARSRKLQRQERSCHARIGSGILQFLVAAGVVRMETRVGDELDGLRRKLADCGQNLIGQLPAPESTTNAPSSPVCTTMFPPSPTSMYTLLRIGRT